MMVSIIVSVCDAAEKLPELIKAIKNSLSVVEHEIIIIDNNSQGGMGDLDDGIAKGYDDIQVVHRNGRPGITSAIAEGIRVSRGEVIASIGVGMLQAPALLPTMLGQIGEHDIVIASRYVDGRHNEKGFWNRIISKATRGITRILLPRVRNIKDPLSSFFLFKRKVMTQVQLSRLRGNHPIGIKLLPELLVNGCHDSVIEIPFDGKKRESGASRFTLRGFFISLSHVLSLLITSGELKRLIKFSMVGGTGLVINMGVLYLLTDKAGLYYLFSAALSWEASIISMFSLHEMWTFRDLRESGVSNIFKRLLKFNIVRSINPVISLSILFCLTDLLGLYYLISNLIAIMIVMIWNYIVSLNVIWRR